MKKTFACFGDSITSNEVCGIGTEISKILDMELTGNFAHGNATCSDWYKDGKCLTTVKCDFEPDIWDPVNTLSNQVYTLLRDFSPRGKKVCWVHPQCGSFSAELFGTERITKKPDVIYIAIGTNDGKTDNGNATPVFDDSANIFKQEYSTLTRQSIASSLRWAIETLKCVFENSFIFVASPLQADSPWEPSAFSYESLYMKRKIIKKVCEYCSVYFIDSFAESGFSKMRVKSYGDICGIHPAGNEKRRIAEFVAHKIKMELY